MNAISAILQVLSGLWSSLATGLLWVFKWFEKLYQLQAWAIGVFIGVLWFGITYAYNLVSYLGGQVATFLGMVDSYANIGGSQIPSAFSTAFSVANALLPLTEFFGFLIFIFPIWALALIIRSIKSWLPTVN